MPDLTTRKAQLDSNERKHLESVVKQLRTRAEKDARYWIEDYFALKKEDAEAPSTLTNREQMLRRRLREAIAREQAGGRSWAKARKLYIKGVGYTLVNRLAALRCMEVRGFLDRAVTRFRADGRTPAADPLIDEHFLAQGEGIWMAFLQACHQQAQEIEILFDLSDPYSLLMGDVANWDGDVDTAESWSRALLDAHVEALQELGSLLDEVDDAVWRADDVLGWVYEYYNVPDLDAVRKKARGKGLDPEDVPVANQFYTPHWVVRMLTDNSLGKLFLEHEGTLQETIKRQQARFSAEERKTRDPEEAASVEELCTYLVPTDEEGQATDFSHPSELRLLDPACGSAHFLLYAFDVLERIWWAMEPSVPRKDVPALVLQHNLFGVDLDLRACQLAAFNLYLKARRRAEHHGATSFKMPTVGIVCADAHVADLDRSHEVFDEAAGGNQELREALEAILTSFEQVEGLGSLLDVRGTLAQMADDVKEKYQLDAFADAELTTLSDLLEQLHAAIRARTENGASFQAKDLRSFLRLLVVLSQDYDVALMNPPYGRGGRMPNAVQSYVEQHYTYGTQFYINFFELNQRLLKPLGRIGMLVPKSFMYKTSYSAFRENFVSGEGEFEFLADFGKGILDKAAVATAGTIVNISRTQGETATGRFFRLHDVAKEKKERSFLRAAYQDAVEHGIQRRYTRPLKEFEMIPGASLSYWVPQSLRRLYASRIVLDADNAKVSDRDSMGIAKVGLQTSDDDRFVRYMWETQGASWVPFAKGGEDSWVLPRVAQKVLWEKRSGHGSTEIERYGKSRPQNQQHYFKPAITYSTVKSKHGRRFGLLQKGSIFGHIGSVIIPERHTLELLAYVNSTLGTYLMLAQKTERIWEVGEVSKLPWFQALADEKLKTASQDILGLLASLRQFQFTSPYYSGPVLLKLLGHTYTPHSHSGHPHRSMLQDTTLTTPDPQPSSTSLSDLTDTAQQFRKEVQKAIRARAADINTHVYDLLDLCEEQQATIEQELRIRYGEPGLTPFSEDIQEGEDKEDSELDFGDTGVLVKQMLLHLTLEILEDDDDGIVLLGTESEDEEADLLARMIAKFDSIWGKYAADRLQEVDEILGNQSSQKEAYPNLRYWLENKLFAFHCSEFENTPILWQLSTDRLVSGSKATGLACIVDYHQLGPDFFDKLSVRYIEPRKAVLRERSRAANSTSGDPGAAASVRARAREEVERYDDALRQIDALEAALRELSQSTPRPWASEVQALAQETAPKVRRFRELFEERLATFNNLANASTNTWLQDLFTNTFADSVRGNQEEWVSALRDLEMACDQFAQHAGEPVEAHLYDIPFYFADSVAGKFGNRSRNKILWAYHYFIDRGKTIAKNIDAQNGLKISTQEKLVADLARDASSEVELAEDIKAACKEMTKPMDAEWESRALEEVMTAGYNPVKKHGVAINITPLAEKKLMPKIVEDKVL